MNEFLQEEMSHNLSWAGDPKYRTAVKIFEAAIFLTAGVSEFLSYFYECAMQLNILYVFSIVIFISVAICRFLISTNYLFALKIWTAYVMKVNLPILVKIIFYILVIATPLIVKNPDIFISSLWLLISGIDFNMRSISKHNLRIKPRN